MSAGPTVGVNQSPAPFERLQSLLANHRRPPVEQWHPRREGRIDINIDRQGAWHHQGAPFTRLALAKLFADILRKDGAGYYLVTPHEKLKIEVEDAPFLVVECECAGQGPARQILLRTSLDEVFPLDSDHPLWLEDRPTGLRPYAEVRLGLNALIARPPYYQLVDLAEEANGRLWLATGGERFDLGPTN